MPEKCTCKHTKYQPTDEEYICPKCGSTCEDGDFYIQNSPLEAMDCELLHDEDEVGCDKCFYSITGKKFAALIQKKKNLVSCPHCKGTGLVKKEKS